jgi:4-hydroxy-3-polyprenylbenzoate decarboxylase
MIVAPCSIKTLSEIANSHNDNLLARAADVCLKERRRLVLLVRETPLHLGHLELMAKASRYGAIILPPVPAFYTRPQTLDDIVNHTVGKALDQFDIPHTLLKRWKDPAGAPNPPLLVRTNNRNS